MLAGSPTDYIEIESRAALFVKIANTAIERVFIVIMVSCPVLVDVAPCSLRRASHETTAMRIIAMVRPLRLRLSVKLVRG
jgi:hypothetical protein